MRLNSFLIGPRSGGRRYGLLSLSAGLSLSPSEERFIGGDLAQMLSAWAARPEAPQNPTFYMALPMPANGRRVVLRGDYAGRLTLGTVAGGLGVVVDEADVRRLHSRFHRLIPHLPRPDVDAAMARTVNIPETVCSEDWRSRTRRPGGDAGFEALLSGSHLSIEVQGPERLAEVLDLVLDDPDAAWVRSWSTTSLVEAVGDLVPERLFDLVVSGRHEPRLGGLAARPLAVVGGGAVKWNPVLPPGAYLVWRTLFKEDSPNRAWPREHAGLSPGEAAGMFALRLAEGLPAGSLADTFGRWSRATAALGPALAAPVRSSLATIFFKRLRTLGPDDAGAALSRYVLDIWPALGRVYPRQSLTTVCEMGLFEHLEPAALTVLATEGMFMAEADPRIAALIAPERMTSDALAGLLAGVALALEPAGASLDAAAADLIADLLVNACARMTREHEASTLAGGFIRAWTSLLQRGPRQLEIVGLDRLRRLCELLQPMLAAPAWGPARLATLRALNKAMDYHAFMVAGRLILGGPARNPPVATVA